MTRDDAELRAHAVSARLGEVQALDEVTLTIPSGSVTAIIGPNGSGKSTLLRALARLLRPDTGSALLDGAEIAKMSPSQVARRIATLPQSPETIPGMTAQELVEQGRYPHTGLLRMFSDRDRAAVERALELTATTPFRRRLLWSLSGGERQRVWIALALAQDPRILLLDEPTTFLDINHQIQVLNLIRALNRERGLTVVMALHDLNQASRYADRLVVLQDGRVVVEGPPAAVITEETIASVFNVHAHISVSPVDGAVLCYPYAALPENGD